MNKHKHTFLYRNEVIGGHWKLHRLFRNPKVDKVLVACAMCHPKKELKIRKLGRLLTLDGE